MKLRLTLLFLLTVWWIVPFFIAGWLGHLPVAIYKRLAFQYTAAGLFTKRAGAWTQMVIQVNHAAPADWKTIDISALSPMGAFGYRQRLDRILQEINGRRQVVDAVKQRLAIWVASTYEGQHPDQGKVVGVRFGQKVWTVNSSELAYPPGHWVPNPPALGPTTTFRPLSSYSIHQGQAWLLMGENPRPVRESDLTPKPAQGSSGLGRQFRSSAPAAK